MNSNEKAAMSFPFDFIGGGRSVAEKCNNG